MTDVTMKNLLEAGVHFGHQTRRWNPKMKSYIFTARNGIHIIDLQQTITGLTNAYNFVVETVADAASQLARAQNGFAGIAFLFGLVALAVGGFFILQRRALPAPGSAIYEQTTRAFYHGLSALEVGLLDDARKQFMSATMLVPQEPASWANLGLTQLRLGELDAAAEPIDRALSLAPTNADIVLLAGRMSSNSLVLSR